MTHAFCSCLRWDKIGEAGLEELRAYTEWVKDDLHERYPSEALFRNGLVRWLVGEGSRVAFICPESGYPHETQVGKGKVYRPKVDLRFALDGVEHWMEIKTGPGPANPKSTTWYKADVEEWRGKWRSDVAKLRNPKLPPSAKRHLVSFGLSRTHEDGACWFYGKSYSHPEDAETRGHYSIAFQDLGTVNWKMDLEAQGQKEGLNRLFMGVVCVEPLSNGVDP